MKMMSMSSDVNCKFSTVNIVNIDVKDGKEIYMNVILIMLMMLMVNSTILDFQYLVSIDRKFCLPNLEIT